MFIAGCVIAAFVTISILTVPTVFFDGARPMADGAAEAALDAVRTALKA